MTLKIIIGLLIINLLYTYYLSREILNPKRYYLVDRTSAITVFIIRIETNGDLSRTTMNKPKWRLPDAMKAKEVYPHLTILDCATLEVLKL